MNVIELQNLTKQFNKGVYALRGVSLQVKQGEIFGYLGPNGSGKTTTVRLLNGTLEPSAGSFTVLKQSGTDGAEAAQQIRSRTATLAENACMYEQLTLLDNLLFFAAMYSVPKAKTDGRIRTLLNRMDLWDRRNDKLGVFSTGMKKKAAIIRTLLHEPEIIFFDEPTAGLDPESAGEVLSLIRELATSEGRTVFMCTHNLPQAETVCTSFGLLNKGKLVSYGTKEELAASVSEGVTVWLRTDRGSRKVVVDSEDRIHGLVQDEIQAGRRIYEVRQEKPGLEEIYFTYLGGEKG